MKANNCAQVSLETSLAKVKQRFRACGVLEFKRWLNPDTPLIDGRGDSKTRAMISRATASPDAISRHAPHSVASSHSGQLENPSALAASEVAASVAVGGLLGGMAALSTAAVAFGLVYLISVLRLRSLRCQQ